MENFRELIQIICIGVVCFNVGFTVASNSYRKRIKLIQSELEKITLKLKNK